MPVLQESLIMADRDCSGRGSRRGTTLELTGALIERTPPTVLGPLSPAQAADELLSHPRRHGYLS